MNQAGVPMLIVKLGLTAHLPNAKRAASDEPLTLAKRHELDAADRRVALRSNPIFDVDAALSSSIPIPSIDPPIRSGEGTTAPVPATTPTANMLDALPTVSKRRSEQAITRGPGTVEISRSPVRWGMGQNPERDGHCGSGLGRNQEKAESSIAPGYVKASKNPLNGTKAIEKNNHFHMDRIVFDCYPLFPFLLSRPKPVLSPPPFNPFPIGRPLQLLKTETHDLFPFPARLKLIFPIALDCFVPCLEDLTVCPLKSCLTSIMV